MFSLYVK